MRLPNKFLPNCNIYNENDTCSTLVISQNLFQCDDDLGKTFPDWVGQYFREAINLYVDAGKMRSSLTLFILAMCCWVVHWIVRIKKYELQQYGLGFKELFVRDMELFQKEFSHWRMWTVIILLCAMYYIDSKYHGYYECTPIVTWFTLSFYFDDNIGTWGYYVLLVLTICMNALLCHGVYRLKCIQIETEIAAQMKIMELRNDDNVLHKPLLELSNIDPPELMTLFLSRITEEKTEQLYESQRAELNLAEVIEVEYDAIPEQTNISRGVEYGKFIF